MNRTLILSAALAVGLFLALPILGPSAFAQEEGQPSIIDTSQMGEVPDITIDTSEYGAHTPPLGSVHGAGVDGMIDVIHWFMGVIFFGWGIFFVYCLAKFRQKPGQKADPMPIKAKSTKLIEVLVAGFEVVLLLAFSFPIWADVKTDIPDEKDCFVVRVVAEQFAWNIHYPGPDGEFGRTDRALINQNNLLGIDLDDPKAADDLIIQNDLHVPMGKQVMIKLSSKDVIHSLFLPVMRVKQDAIPGMVIPVWFTSREGYEGSSEIQCAQLCGNNHSIMKGFLTVESEEAVKKWIKDSMPEDFDFDEQD